MALCPVYLSAGFSGFKEKGTVPESSDKGDNCKSKMAQLEGPWRSSLGKPSFTEKKTEVLRGK